MDKEKKTIVNIEDVLKETENLRIFQKEYIEAYFKLVRKWEQEASKRCWEQWYPIFEEAERKRNEERERKCKRKKKKS